jgi:hypothetical protein
MLMDFENANSNKNKCNRNKCNTQRNILFNFKIQSIIFSTKFSVKNKCFFENFRITIFFVLLFFLLTTQNRKKIQDAKKVEQFETEFNEKQILGFVLESKDVWGSCFLTMCLVGEPRERSGADLPRRCLDEERRERRGEIYLQDPGSVLILARPSSSVSASSLVRLGSVRADARGPAESRRCSRPAP